MLGVGLATLDHYVTLDRFPDPDTKAETSLVLEEGGGPVATALVAAARLGAICRIVAVVGDDDDGRTIRGGLADEGLDVAGMVMRPGRRSPFSFIVVEPGAGRRTIFWNRGDLEPQGPSDLAAGLVEGAAALLVDGHQLAAQLAAVHRARSSGVPVVLDAGSVRPATRELLPLADHAVVSERFARDWAGQGGEGALRALQAAGPCAVVITSGEGGCRGREGSEVVAVPALPVENPDTNGAGDVFHGAYVAALVRGMALGPRLRLATATAGLKCRQPGPRRGIPVLTEALAAAGLGVSSPAPPASPARG